MGQDPLRQIQGKTSCSGVISQDQWWLRGIMGEQKLRFWWWWLPWVNKRGPSLFPQELWTEAVTAVTHPLHHTHTRPTSPQSHSSPRSCGAYTPCSTCIIEINLSQQNWGGGRPRSNGSQCDRDRGGGPAELERPGSQQGCENDFLATVGKKLEGFFFCSNPVKGTVHHTENYHCD